MGQKRIRVLSYNIHQGLTIHKRKLALGLLKGALKSLKADIVLLQEVAGIQRGSGLHGKGGVTSFQLEALADEIWPYYAYGRNAAFSGGFHGNAILSRYPITKWENVDISLKALQRKALKQVLPKRGMLHAEIQLLPGEERLNLISTHFGLLQFERRAQLKLLTHYVNRLGGGAFLVAGDFNDWRELITKKISRELKAKEAHLSVHRSHARTFPSRVPVLCLDRIYFRGLEVISAHRLKGRPWHFLSDHLPLVADFKIPE